jgi:hypothetical protein
MNGVYGLAQYLATVITETQQTTSTFQGQISGSAILINGAYYPFVVAVDVQASDGDIVWCMLNETQTVAVVVGA